jgi:hypothetical protein
MLATACWRHLEDVERLKLYAAGAVFEHVHHLHEVLSFTDVTHHQPHITAIQEQLAQQLQSAGSSSSSSKQQPSVVANRPSFVPLADTLVLQQQQQQYLPNPAGLTHSE